MMTKSSRGKQHKLRILPARSKATGQFLSSHRSGKGKVPQLLNNKKRYK